MERAERMERIRDPLPRRSRHVRETASDLSPAHADYAPRTPSYLV
ncbi:hypothetical protein ACFVT2_00785 [Streptomyces sp. NPDC058000]